jgi:cyclic pyranopterin phosphate synthase
MTPMNEHEAPSSESLSHVEESGGRTRGRMVDVGKKPATRRAAVARACLRFPPGVLAKVLAGEGPKGPIEEAARCAGLLGAKRTAELIPMCHPLPLDHLELRFEARDPDVLEIRCEARTEARTGVEMEALTGASVAALTVYDMTKALAKGISIERVELLAKRGGASGDWVRG